MKKTETVPSKNWHESAAFEVFKGPEQMLAGLVGTPTVGVAICDKHLHFEAINNALAAMNGIPAEAHLGRTVREILGNLAGQVEPALRHVLATGELVLGLEIAGRLPTRTQVGHWIENYFPIKDSTGRVRQVGAVVVEITSDESSQPNPVDRAVEVLLNSFQISQQTRESLHQLSARLLQYQDAERRRIARQLHDTVGQTLVALKMNLAKIIHSKFGVHRTIKPLVSESVALTEECTKEIRTLSHVLHPPLLDEAGLACALRWYVAGFQERSGITVTLEMPDDLQRLPEEVETAVFRIVQECLINAHRHSGSPTTKIKLARDPQGLLVEVQDEGRGMPAHALVIGGQSPANLGVGIAGIRNRVKQLGGKMEIHSGDRGTKITVVLP